jgi:hypothetical protein
MFNFLFDFIISITINYMINLIKILDICSQRVLGSKWEISNTIWVINPMN